MKILIVTGIYPPDIGGPATYSQLIEKELKQKGFETEVLVFTQYKKWPKIIRHLAFLLAIIKRSRKVDLYYAQDPVSVGLPTMLAAWLTRIPFALKIVGDYAWEQGRQRFGVTDNLDTFSKKNSYSLATKLLKSVQTLVAKRAKLIIVPSQYLKKIITNWGIKENKITVIYNSFDLKINLSDKNILRQELNLNKFTLISVGRLVPWKGFTGLIDLMIDLSEMNLLIVGSGPDESVLKERIKIEGISNVKFLGSLPQTELFKYIKASDIFVLNTSYEGFSHQLLEVMAIGTPIITTKDRKSTRLNSSHLKLSRMPSSA